MIVNPPDIMKSQRNRIINALPKLGNKLEPTTRKLTIQETLNRINPDCKAGSLGCTEQQRMLAYMFHSLMNVAWRKTSGAYQRGGVVHLRTRGLGNPRRARSGGTPIDMMSIFQKDGAKVLGYEGLDKREFKDSAKSFERNGRN